MSRLLDDDELAEAFSDVALVALGYRTETRLSGKARIEGHIAALTAQLEAEKAEGDRLAAAVTASVTSYRGVVQRG